MLHDFCIREAPGRVARGQMADSRSRPVFPVDSPRGDFDIAEVSREKCRERFKNFLDQHDLRVTGQRMAIFDAAFSQSTHFTAEELLDKSRDIDESVSRATVYRALPIMIESGILREVDIGKSLKYYLPNNPEDAQQQAQVICVDCDRIYEVAAPFMEWYGTTVSGRLGLSPVSQRLQVTATCNEFRSTGRCKNRRSGR